MDEDFAARLEPGGEFGEEGGVAFHVFEHFDGEDVGESVAGLVVVVEGTEWDSLLFFLEIELGEIAGNDLYVVESLLLAYVVDKDLLRSRVGQHLDGCLGVHLREVVSTSIKSENWNARLTSARYDPKLPHPQPKSKIFNPSPSVLPSSPLTGPNPALTVYIFNIASSASPNDSLA